MFTFSTPAFFESLWPVETSFSASLTTHSVFLNYCLGPDWNDELPTQFSFPRLIL